MKKILAFLILFVVASTACAAQDTLKRTIPSLKESAKIDSLISLLLHSDKRLKADSCLMIYFNKSRLDAGSIGGLKVTDRGKTIFTFASMRTDKNLGYFEYEGHFILVCGTKFMNQFFKKTLITREFYFVKPTPEQLISLIRHTMGWTIFYENGNFNYGVH